MEAAALIWSWLVTIGTNVGLAFEAVIDFLLWLPIELRIVAGVVIIVLLILALRRP